MRSVMSLALFALLVIGCGEASESPRSAYEALAVRDEVQTMSPPDAKLAFHANAGFAQPANAPADAPAGNPPAGAQVAVPSPPRIIYTAQMTLVVKDLSKVAETIHELVRTHDGYLADAQVNRTHGAFPNGRWVARVPTQRFEALMDSLEQVGVPEQRTQSAQDVTEEYVDLEARIVNKKQLEDRVAELLKQRDGKIEEVLEVERELNRVREEIERMEGRLRYLQSRTAYATVTITAREEKDYIPPQAPTFTSQIQTTWSGSLLGLRRFGERLTLAAVAFTPWLLPLCVVLVPILWLARRIYRRATGSI